MSKQQPNKTLHPTAASLVLCAAFRLCSKLVVIGRRVSLVVGPVRDTFQVARQRNGKEVRSFSTVLKQKQSVTKEMKKKDLSSMAGLWLSVGTCRVRVFYSAQPLQFRSFGFWLAANSSVVASFLFRSGSSAMRCRKEIRSNSLIQTSRESHQHRPNKRLCRQGVSLDVFLCLLSSLCGWL